MALALARGGDDVCRHLMMVLLRHGRSILLLLLLHLLQELIILHLQPPDALQLGGVCRDGLLEGLVDDIVDARVPEGEGFPCLREDDDAYLRSAENGELAGLLDEPHATLREADLPGARVLDLLDLDLGPPHGKEKSEGFESIRMEWNGMGWDGMGFDR